MQYYSNFSEYREPLKQGLATVQRLLSTCESMIRFRRAPPPDWTDAEEVATWSSELLDDVVEKIESALDAERARARGREAGPRRGESAAANPSDDAALRANLPSFGGNPVLSNRRKDQRRFGVHLARPQALFEPQPDNRRDTPFRPRVDHLVGLTVEPFDPRVYLPTLGAPEEYPHPFAANLAALTYRPDQLQPPAQAPQLPPDLDDTPLMWVDSKGTLAAMVSELEAAGELAVDLEAHTHRSFQGFTCLMQISTRKSDYVVDTLALRNLLGPALARIFSDPRIVKVLHGADFDVEWLQRDFGLFLVNMFDTGQAARVLSLPSFGLAYLMEHYCGVKPDKRYQLADWRIRPLSPEMLHYARGDTHYLLYIYDRLRGQLAAMVDSQIPQSLAVPLPVNNAGAALGLVLERSRQLCLKTYRKPVFSPEGCQDLLLRWNLSFSRQQANVFTALMEWRDVVGRAEDEGTGYVLPKAQLITLARLMPEDSKQVQSTLGRAASEVVTRRMGELLDVIKTAKNLPIEQALAASAPVMTRPPSAAADVAEALAKPAADTTTSVAVAATAAAAAAVPAAAAATAAATSVAGGVSTQRAALPILKPRAIAPIRTVSKAAAAVVVPPATGLEASAGPRSSEPLEDSKGAVDAAVVAAAGASEPSVALPAAATATLTAAAAAVVATIASPPSRPVSAVRRVQIGSSKSGGGTSLLGSIFGGGAASSINAMPALQGEPAARPAGTAAAPTAVGNGDGDNDEERLARQRVKRLRATFTLPFATAATARLPSALTKDGGAGEAAPATAAATDTDDGAAEGKTTAAITNARPSVTAYDIRAAVEAMRAEGGDVEIVIGADGRSATAPFDERGRGGAGGGSLGPAGGRDAPAARTIADSESDGDDVRGDSGADDGAAGEAAAAANGNHGAGEGRATGAAGIGDQRVAGSELGLDVLDYVPVPLSQLVQKKKKRDRANKQPAENTAGAEDGGVTAPKRRRFMTGIPAVAGGHSDGAGAGIQYDGGADSDSDDDSGSDGGHTVGPFAKRRPPKKQHKNQPMGQPPKMQLQPGDLRRHGKPTSKGLMDDFPRSNIARAAPEEGRSGRGGRGGGREGVRGGRGGGRGRQPTAFNPFDIPDEFLMKGGRRSTVMPRSGNRTSTFKG
ncbi:hypothetical protein Vretimale_3481 [Volvox reticuliferus]|uniref:HRDC domain-containing protein n=1 Tax=Volvox reticuliferus TaxID=1737510 RepID=A0A8J4G1G8_9CHLO|nr:hypothetical protein Vretimale_3481 [Volvox reticuliferus]